ncbi:MAG TPA: glucose-6-phosphate dehydrogenase [Xanthobacteraceae bacterium]|jgi:glucose-6-phosphate 1-dehydrogenase|nr:glucose-6-phosphate dehydrogenase [Xanthobacteraceae bacterium]
MEREGSGPSSLLNGATPGNGSRPRDAADAAATIGKSFPGRRPAPATMVIFGAAGDLTKRLVVPALYNLVRGGKLPEGFAMIGIDRNDETTEAWRSNLTNMIQAFARAGGGERQALDEQAWSSLVNRMHYMRGDFTQAETYGRLEKLLNEQCGRQGGTGHVLFYLAVADRFFGPVIEQLGRAGLARQSETAWRRVIIEKPFGHDFASAEALNAQILKVLSEDQIYRIDHFLGKETVQNILVLRFANGIFEPLWNRDHIDHVQITAAETVGVEARGRFYEKTGALRDMVPNHLFQLLAMIAMEPPISFDADAVRAKKTELFQALHPISPENAVRGQYAAGVVLGKSVGDYRREADVAPDSGTETYVALKLGIDNWRWAGVPFYLRTGKYLSARTTEVAVQFRQAPYALFRDTPVERLPPNILMLRIQPDEGLSLSFSAKRPGADIEIDGVQMDFAYRDYFAPLASVGYETLIYDCLIGDATLFQRADAVEAGWRAVQGLIDAWAKTPAEDFPNYAAGSAGPAAADRLLARDGRAWLPIRADHRHTGRSP